MSQVLKCPFFNLAPGLLGTSDFLQEFNAARMIKNLEKIHELQVGKQPEAEEEELRMGMQGERRKGLRLQHK